MRRSHKFYLSLGSNIAPEANLAEAVARLGTHGRIEDVSSVWESRPLGSTGPNFLNVCVLFVAPLVEKNLRSDVLRRVEAELGRVRSSDKNAPRTIDIDPLMMDGRALNLARWEHPFVIMPMAELCPDLVHPTRREAMSEVARQIQSTIWIVRRPATVVHSPKKSVG